MNQPAFNFIHSQRAYQIKYLQFPFVLLKGDQYRHLSDGAKLCYMVLNNRLDSSLKNNWIDENDRVYFIYTIKELQELMTWSNKKVIKVKKELESAGLLFQRKMGFDPKSKRNKPNRLYLADLEVTAQDVYIRRNVSYPRYIAQNDTNPLLQADVTKRHSDINFEETSQSLATNGRNKTTLRPKKPKTLDISGHDKITPYIDNNTLDTNTDTITDTEPTEKEWNFSQNNYSQQEITQQNADLMRHSKMILDSKAIPNFLNDEGVRLIQKWVKTPAIRHAFISVILNAKNDSLKIARKQGCDVYIIFEENDNELKFLVTQTLYGFFDKVRTGDIDHSQKILNPQKYLFVAMRNLFCNYLNDKLQKEKAVSKNE